MDRPIEDWIRAQVEPVGVIETTHERPWATVMRVPLVEGVAWFKACAPVQAFEPRLTAGLFARWPDRVTSAMTRSGRGFSSLTRARPSACSAIRRRRGSARCRCTPSSSAVRPRTCGTTSHTACRTCGSRRFLHATASSFSANCRSGATRSAGSGGLRRVSPSCATSSPRTAFRRRCSTTTCTWPTSMPRVGGCGLVDWGDASISHPFASLVVTFRFLEERNGLPPADPWFARLRDAHLEPWGNGLAGAFALAVRVGTFAHTLAWARQRDHLPPEARAAFDRGFEIVLRRALARTLD